MDSDSEADNPACVCAVCANPAQVEDLAEASWLPPMAVDMLREVHPGWELAEGACPECVRAALNDFLMLQGRLSQEEKMRAAGSLSPEIAFGILPTPMRLPSDPRYRGRGVTIAFVDAGFYPHPDLVRPRNRIRAWADAAAGPPNVIAFGPDDTPRWPGWDRGDPSQWHGLMTSCVAAGNGWRSHRLYQGLASEADVVLVRARGEDGRITNDNIARALRWIKEHGEEFGVRVVSISVAGEHVDWLVGNPVDDAVAALVRGGITVVAASGNEGSRHLVPPATAPSALTIGGVDDMNNFSPKEVDVWHSNYGTSVTGMTKPELVAPSIWVVAPVLPNTGVAREAVELFKMRQRRDEAVEQRIAELKLVTPHYQHVDGTSFAAPLVASVVACMLEANPEITPYEVRQILTATAQPVEGVEKERQGAGALEPARAIGLALRAEGGPMIGFPLSPRIDESGMSFCIYDPDAQQVTVRGSWDGWSESGIQAEQIRPHIWCAHLDPLPPGTYAYRFVLDDNRWLYDLDNPRKTTNDFGGFDSVLEIPGGEPPREAKVDHHQPGGQMLGGGAFRRVTGIW